MAYELSRDQAKSVFEEYSAFVYRTALLLTQSRALADDVTQETFVSVLRNIHTFDPSKPIRPWIYKITVNVARNMLRKHKWLTYLGKIPDTLETETTEELFLRNEEERELKKAVDELPLKSREVIILHFYAGLTLNEVSDVLEIPLGTCKSRLNTALNRLRKRLQMHHYFSYGKNGYESFSYGRNGYESY